jgi:glutaredoxin 3
MKGLQEGGVSAPKVVMYVTSWCPYCERARELLNKKGVAFEEIDVDARPEARSEMTARSGRRTVPQIFIGESRLDPMLNTGALK